MYGEEVKQILFDKQVAAETEKKRIETNEAERAKKKLDKENAAVEKATRKEAQLITFNNQVIKSLKEFIKKN